MSVFSRIKKYQNSISIKSVILCVFLLWQISYSVFAVGYVFNWTARTSAGQVRWQSITSSADGTKLAAVASTAYSGLGYISTSSNSGATWTQRTSAGLRDWKSITSSSDGSKLAAVTFSDGGGAGGFIYTSSDSGATWTARTSAGQRQWFRITSSSNGTKLAAFVLNGSIYTSSDSGFTWIERTTAGTSRWRDITSSADGTKLAATTENGYIYTSSDSGATWTQRTGSGARMWAGITSSADGTKLAAADGYYGYIYTSSDSGVTWIERTTSGKGSWTSITSSSDGTKLAAAESNFMYTSSDSGATWKRQIIEPFTSWPSITSSADGTKLATVNSNSIYTATSVSDTTPPVITSVSSNNPNGTYSVGSPITIDVTFSEPVSGIVTVTFETGIIDRTCTFTLFSETTSPPRHCDYIVQANDISLDLDVKSITGTIVDQADNPLTNFIPITGLATAKQLVIGTCPSSITTGTYPSCVCLNGLDYNSASNTCESITPPTLSAGTPTGTQSSGSVTLGVTTNKAATCKYSTTANTAYSTMTDTFSTTGGTAHSKPLTGLTNGTKTYYVRCSDTANNVNTTDYVITFSITTAISSVNLTWIPHASVGFNFGWDSVTSSYDGTKLAATPRGSNRQIFTSSDGGLTWIKRTKSPSRYWKKIVSSENGSVLVAIPFFYVGALPDYIYTSVDGGDNWYPELGAGLQKWWDITVSRDGTSIAAVNSDQQSIYLKNQQGWTVKTHSNSLGRNFYFVQFSSSNNLLATYGANNINLGILTSNDFGSSWNNFEASGNRQWEAITSSSDGQKLAAVVDSEVIYNNNVPTGDQAGYIYTSSNAGVIWEEQRLAGKRWWHKITSSADGTKLAALVWYNDYIYVSIDSGRNWTPQTNLGKTNVQWRDIAFSGDGTKLVAVNANDLEIFTASLTTGLSCPVGSNGIYPNCTCTGGTYNAAQNTCPPIISGGTPTGTQSSGSVTLGVTTDKAATCKYSTTANTAYSAMTNTFATTGGTTHTKPLTGLASGSHTYYVRCSDTTNNVNTTDYVITFTIGTAPTCPAGQYFCSAENLCKPGNQSCTPVTCNNNGTCDTAESCNCADCNGKPSTCGLSGTTQLVCAQGASTSTPTGGGIISYVSQFSSQGAYRIAIDASGNIFVVDGRNHRVQKFSSSGAYISQFGTQGSGNGQFNSPTGIAIDASGNIFVVDGLNHRVQKFSSSGAYISQFGTQGSGNGQFFNPAGIAIDASGNIFIVDYQNHRVQKFSSSGAYISGVGGLFYPSGIAINASGNIYVADGFNNNIKIFSNNLNLITQFGSEGSGNGQFNSPTGIAIDASGNIFVSEFGHHRVQKFSSSGAYISQFGTQGSGNGQFNLPSAITINASGNIFVTDYGNNRVQILHDSGVVSSPTSSLQGACCPPGSTWNTMTNTCVDSTPPTLSAGTPTGTVSSGSVTLGVTTDKAATCKYSTTANTAYSAMTNTFATTGGTTHTKPLTGLASGSHTYYVRCSDTANNVNTTDYVITFTIGAPTCPAGQYFCSAENLCKPGNQSCSPITCNNNGTCDTAESCNCADCNGKPSTCAMSGTTQLVCSQTMGTNSGSSGLAQLPYTLENVLKFGSSGTGDGQFGFVPRGVAVDTSGNIYVADVSNHRIQKFNSSGTYIAQFGTLGGSLPSNVPAGNLSQPYDIAFDAAENIYVADAENAYIQKFDKNGSFISRFLTSTRSQTLFVDAGGNVYISSGGGFGVHNVMKYNSLGTKILDFGTNGSGNGQFSYPRDLVVDSSGNIYVVDSGNGRIQKFNSNGSYISQFGTYTLGTGFKRINSIAIDSGDNIYVSYDDGIKKFNSDGAYISQLTTFSGGYMTVDSSDNMYVSGILGGTWQTTGSLVVKFKLPESTSTTLQGACCPPGSTWNTTTNICSNTCPLNSTGTYPTCVCPAGGVYNPTTNTCPTTCPPNSTGTHPTCTCPLGSTYDTLTNTCTASASCTNTQAPSELKAGLDQPYITCTGDGDVTKTHFKYRTKKLGSTNPADTFTSEAYPLSTQVLHPTMQLGTYSVECFYGTATSVDTTITAAPHPCAKTMTVNNTANGCSRIFPYKNNTLSEAMVSTNAFDATFRCGSRTTIPGTVSQPFMFRLGTQPELFPGLDPLVSELFNGLSIGPVSTATQRYSFTGGSTFVSCAVKLGSGYSTNNSCYLNACVGANCSTPQTYSVIASGDKTCTRDIESNYTLGCNPEASDRERNLCIKKFRDAIAASGNVPHGTPFNVVLEFNSIPTTIQCIQYGPGQMPGGMNLADNVVCQALLKNGQRHEIFSADGNAIQSTAKALGLDTEPPTLAPIKYYTDETLTTEVTPNTWYNKPVVALAVCNDTPVNESGDCACAQTVHPSTTDASLWNRGIPNNLLGADVMRYTRTITDTLSGVQNIQISDTAGNTATTPQPLSIFLDTTPPQVTVTESGTGTTKSVTIAVSDTGSKIWKTTTAPADTKNTQNFNGIVYRVGPKTDLSLLKFDTNCDYPALFASPTETQTATFPSQATLTVNNFNISSQIITYCVRDNAGNTKRGIYPAIIDACFSATNMPIIPDLDSYKNLTKTRLQGTGNDNFKYGYSFSANPQDAACFRGILSTNITTLVTNQLIPRTTTTLSNWEADPALVRNFPNLPNTSGYYYYAFSGGTNNTVSINSTPTGTGQKSVIVDGGNIRITQNLIYTGGDKILLLIAQKNSEGQGGDIIIDPTVTRIDAVLIASGGALKSTNSSTPAERLTINGRIYSYNTRGGSIGTSATDLIDSASPKKFLHDALISTNITEAKQQDLERLRPMYMDMENTCSVTLNYQVFNPTTLPKLGQRPPNFQGNCGM